MNQMTFIRTEVFKLKQAEFACLARVGQATVSRWENGESFPSLDDLQTIRSEAAKRGIEWDHEWLFAETPAQVSR